MPGLVPGIHVVPKEDPFEACTPTWIAGTSPAMTDKGQEFQCLCGAFWFANFCICSGEASFWYFAFHSSYGMP